MTDTSASTEISQAATRIRDIASKATPGPWGVGNGTTVARRVEQLSVGSFTCLQAVTDTDMFDGREDWSDGDQDYVNAAAEDDAEHIALFDPFVAELISRLLNEAAAAWTELESHNAHCSDGLMYPDEPDAAMSAALELAREINVPGPSAGQS